MITRWPRLCARQSALRALLRLCLAWRSCLLLVAYHDMIISYYANFSTFSTILATSIEHYQTRRHDCNQVCKGNYILLCLLRIIRHGGVSVTMSAAPTDGVGMGGSPPAPASLVDADAVAVRTRLRSRCGTGGSLEDIGRLGGMGVEGFFRATRASLYVLGICTVCSIALLGVNWIRVRPRFHLLFRQSANWFACTGYGQHFLPRAAQLSTRSR